MAFNFKKLFIEDNDVNRLQLNVDEALRNVQNLPWMNGIFISDVVLTTAVDNRIDHGLGRAPNGFLVINKTATGDVWQSTTANALPDRVLIMRSSVTLTVKLWVF